MSADDVMFTEAMGFFQDSPFMAYHIHEIKP